MIANIFRNGKWYVERDILELLKKTKQQRQYTIIDIGGAHDGWSYDVCDAILDISSPTIKTINWFQGNINYSEGWSEVLDFVKNNDKFDFSICSHTLEDIGNPVYVCEMLGKISKEGFIQTPSKYHELSLVESENPMRGWSHHRWIFDIIDNEFWGLPKTNITEDPIFQQFSDTFNKDAYAEKSNLAFYWKNDIKLNIVNNDFFRV